MLIHSDLGGVCVDRINMPHGRAMVVSERGVDGPVGLKS